jgi:3-carboxymuconate cyclase
MSRSGWLLCGVLCILAITAGSTWGNQPAGFLYVANGWTGNISAYAIDQATGALAEAPGSPFLAGVNPVSIVADASGRFVYVTNAGTFFTGNTISAFRVDELTGALTPVPGSPFLLPEGSIPQALAADPAGRFLYTTIRFPVSQSGAVAVFGINQTNGALTTSQTLGLPALYTATSLAAEPSGQFLYVASCPPPDPGQTSEHSCNTKAGVVFAFAVSDSGALSKVPGSPFLAGKYPQSIAASPTGLFVYVANFSSHSVSAYGIGALGELSPVPGSPFAAPARRPRRRPMR